jgi:hypothetical protein
MAWRKWIVRTVVYGIIGACALGGLLYQRWTNPIAVRAQVLDKLGELFPGAVVSIDSARLRLLGGIDISDLRLVRRDDPQRHEILHVPRAVFYHDKEQILDGKLAIRKMDLYLPRLRARRDKDGRWNVQGLTGQINLRVAIPTIVVHQGTIIVEDRAGSLKPAPVEFNDVSLTLINDPITTVTLRGAARAELLGPVRWQGEWTRASGAVSLGFRALELPLTPQLLAQFGGSSLPALTGLALEARADVQGMVALRPGQQPPLSYEVRCLVHDGKVQHPQLPLPLEQLSAELSCANGDLRLQRLSARSGAAELSLSGSGRLPQLDQEFECQLDVKHLDLCDEMCLRLPEKLRNLHNLFRVNGPTSLHVACARHGGEWATLASGEPSHVLLQPEGVSMAFVKFPYPLEKLTGSLHFDLQSRHIKVDIAGGPAAHPVFIQGHWSGEGAQADASFDIRASNVIIDDNLLAALPTSPTDVQKLARSFRARGKVDIKAHIRHEPGARAYRNQYHVHFHDAGLRWDDFPYPLENVSGALDIYPGHWEFHNFRGAHRGGHVVVNGKSTPTLHPVTGERNHGVTVEIAGRDIAIDDELQQAIARMSGLARAWDKFRPSGRLSFTAEIKRAGPHPDDLSVNVDARGCSVEPRFFAYRLDDLGGQFLYEKRRLSLTHVRARHGRTILAVESGVVDLHGGDGFHANVDVQAQDLRLDEPLASALPGKLREMVRSLKVQGPVQLKTKLVIAQAPEQAHPPVIWWDGQAWLDNATVNAGPELRSVTGTLTCDGLHNGQHLEGLSGNILFDRASLLKQQPFTNVVARFEVAKSAPDVLLLSLRAPIYGGDVTGQVRLDLHSTLGYEMNLTASQIDLAQLGRTNFGDSTQMQGIAVGRLYLRGQGRSLDSLEGDGSIDVPSGRLGKDLPLLLDLIKFLGLHWPDRTAFEELHALFGIRGRRVHMRRLELYGNAISLSGKGEFNLDGSEVQIDFYPTWARIDQLLPPLVRPLPPAVSKNLLTIEVRGNANNGSDALRFNKKLVPIVVDPLLVLRDRVIGREKE